MNLKLAMWNVNSIRARQESVLRWLIKESPDVLCIQEIKGEVYLQGMDLPSSFSEWVVLLDNHTAGEPLPAVSARYQRLKNSSENGLFFRAF